MKYTILSFIAILAFTSCGTVSFNDELNDSETSSEQTKGHLVTFSVDGSSDAFTVSRAESTILSDRFSTLQYWIYDADYKNVVTSGTQNSSDSSFGKFSEYLAYGTYNIVVVGHNLKHEMSISDDNMVEIEAEDERHGDTYYGNSQFTVSDESTTATTITLNRNMCKVYVISNGSAANVSYVDMSVSAYGTSFYASTGFTNTVSDVNSYKITLTDANRNTQPIRFHFYFPLPKAETVFEDVSITLTAYDMDNKKLKSVTISKIPAKIGREITYEGSLWGNNQTFTVNVSDTEWEKISNQKY